MWSELNTYSTQYYYGQGRYFEPSKVSYLTTINGSFPKIVSEVINQAEFDAKHSVKWFKHATF